MLAFKELLILSKQRAISNSTTNNIVSLMFNLLAGEDYAKSFHSECGCICDSEADWTVSGQGGRNKMAGSLSKGDRMCLFCIAPEVSQGIRGRSGRERFSLS